MPPSHASGMRSQSARVSLKSSRRHRPYLWRMPGLLIVAAAGPDDPTRASVPFHIAVNGAKPAGPAVAIALGGDAAELVQPDVIAKAVGVAVPSLAKVL